jgi:hypothetical protein
MLTSILLILVYKPKWQVLVIKSVGGSHIIPQWENGVTPPWLLVGGTEEEGQY